MAKKKKSKKSNAKSAKPEDAKADDAKAEDAGEETDADDGADDGEEAEAEDAPESAEAEEPAAAEPENQEETTVDETPASDREAELEATVADLQTKLEGEVTTVRNFSAIGVLVFAAGLVLLVAWDTQPIDLVHQMRPVRSLVEEARDELDKNIDKWRRSYEKSKERLIHETAEAGHAVIAESSFGTETVDAQGGVTVTKVTAGSPAAQLGLKPGSVVKSVNGLPVGSKSEYHEALMTLVTAQPVSVNGAGKSVAFTEAVSFIDFEHGIEHFADEIERITVAHWKAVKRLDESFQARRQAERDRIAVHEMKGRSSDVEIAKNRIAGLEKDRKARVAELEKIRDQRVAKAAAHLKHEIESQPAVVAMVLPQKDGAEETFAAKLTKAADDYWRSRVSGEVSLAHNAKTSFKKEQRALNKLYRDYASFMEPKLTEVFGTPQEPRIAGSEEYDKRGMLRRGAQFYFRHCQHCHGVSGYGDGPTAPFLTPRPRNYTRGEFKCRSNKTPKPSIKDLVRTLKYGMNGSMMPPFEVYDDADLQAVAHYVRYLSIRGEVEYFVHQRVFKLQELDLEENVVNQLAEFYEEAQEIVLSKWGAIEDQQIEVEGEPVAYDPEDPEPYLESLKLGRKLFIAQCATCHGHDGQGGGEQADGMYDNWGYKIEPRNLTRGVYRGGGRPIDIYWRIAGGITGTPMPAFPKLTAEEKWAIVNYVRSLAAEGPDAVKAD